MVRRLAIIEPTVVVFRSEVLDRVNSVTGKRVKNLEPRLKCAFFRLLRLKIAEGRCQCHQPTTIVGQVLNPHACLARLNHAPRPIANEVKNAGSDRAQKADEERTGNEPAKDLHGEEFTELACGGLWQVESNVIELKSPLFDHHFRPVAGNAAARAQLDPVLQLVAEFVERFGARIGDRFHGADG
jgi:hypothetical protein